MFSKKVIFSKLPGPSEEGLKWVREGTKTVTRLGKFWFGPFNLAVSVIHPETVKVIFKTSGILLC